MSIDRLSQSAIPLYTGLVYTLVIVVNSEIHLNFLALLVAILSIVLTDDTTSFCSCLDMWYFRLNNSCLRRTFRWSMLYSTVTWKRLKPIFHGNVKPFALGPGVGLDHRHHNFALGIPTCWYLKTLKFALPPPSNLKFALPPNATPNTSRWNIGCVGSPAVGAGIGHVHFIFFVLISFALGSHSEPLFQWNMGFNNSCLHRTFRWSKLYLTVTWKRLKRHNTNCDSNIWILPFTY